MLYLLGGASRAGKSTVARRLLEEHAVPYFSLDVLMMGLVRGYPAFRLNPDDTPEVRAARLWPLVHAMAVNLLEEEPTHPTYLLEGDALLPRQAHALMQEYPGRVRACFIGYARVDPVRKLANLRTTERDWLADYGDVEVLDYVADMVRFSRFLERQCAQSGLAYFDGSADFETALVRACRFLTDSGAGLAPGRQPDLR